MLLMAIKSCALLMLSILMAVCTEDLKTNKYFENKISLISNYDTVETCNHNRSVSGAVQIASNPIGYICQVKSGLIFCCHPDKVIRYYAVNLTLYKGKVVEGVDDFAVNAIFEISCVDLEDNASNDRAQGQWKLFENGRLLDPADKSALQQEEYCLISLNISKDYHELVSKRLKPEIQIKAAQNPNLDLLMGIKVVSVLCMAITIVLYLYLPQFQSVYCKCCLCYFVCLTFIFLLLCADYLYRDGWSSRLICYIIGYCIHYTMMAVFLWLLVINCILWKTFHNFGIINMMSMLRYHILVWSTAAVLPVITEFFGNTFDVRECLHIQEELHTIYYCRYSKNNFNALIVYNGPICLVTVINLTLSILTAKHIYLESKLMDLEWNSSESQRNMANKADFIIFLRLFAIAGVIWLFFLLETIFSLFENSFETITFISETILSAQGILLLLATIWKKNVLDSLLQRLKIKVDKSISTSST